MNRKRSALRRPALRLRYARTSREQGLFRLYDRRDPHRRRHPRHAGFDRHSQVHRLPRARQGGASRRRHHRAQPADQQLSARCAQLSRQPGFRGHAGKLDPWGRPYVYLNLQDPATKGLARKNKNLVPINSDYDLYSIGKDGESRAPLTAKVSRDDVIRANDGGFLGLAGTTSRDQARHLRHARHPAHGRPVRGVRGAARGRGAVRRLRAGARSAAVAADDDAARRGRGLRQRAGRSPERPTRWRARQPFERSGLFPRRRGARARRRPLLFGDTSHLPVRRELAGLDDAAGERRASGSRSRSRPTRHGVVAGARSRRAPPSRSRCDPSTCGRSRTASLPDRACVLGPDAVP